MLEAPFSLRPLPSIRPDRLWESIQELARIGAYTDSRTGLQGVNRLALTDADGQGRHQVKKWFMEAGLEVRVDRIGNVYGRRPGTRPGAAPVLSGSHIDSVPTGGAFDGALGVLGALECVRAMNEVGWRTGHPVEIAFFTDEEGARFGTDMLGSAVAVGRLPLDSVYGLRDRQGLTVREELERIGFLGEHEERLDPPHAYVECHIEQGPILDAEELDLGIVTGVQAISWQELTVSGRSAHAGTTPMGLRQDASVAAARVLLKVHEMAVSGRYGGDARATVGGFEPHPGLVNIVPGAVRMTIDLRNPDDSLMASSEKDLALFLSELETESGMSISSRQTARTGAVFFSSQIQEIIGEKIRSAGHSSRRLISGAGHDAQEMASLCPTGMVFVPGLYQGISHNPREYSTPEQCARGVSILLETLVELAE